MWVWCFSWSQNTFFAPCRFFFLSLLSLIKVLGQIYLPPLNPVKALSFQEVSDVFAYLEVSLIGDKSIGDLGHDLSHSSGIKESDVSDPKHAKYKWDEEEEEISSATALWICSVPSRDIVQIYAGKLLLQQSGEVAHFLMELRGRRIRVLGQIHSAESVDPDKPSISIVTRFHRGPKRKASREPEHLTWSNSTDGSGLWYLVWCGVCGERRRWWQMISVLCEI